MVSKAILNGATMNADGQVTLSDGRTFSLSDIPGNSWNANRLGKLAVAVQALFDHSRLIADLDPIDLDRVHAEVGDNVWFSDTYGGRMFIDGDSIVSRSDLISFTFENGELVPHLETVH